MCNGVRASSTVFLFDTLACINIYSERINNADFYKRTFHFVYEKKKKEKHFTSRHKSPGAAEWLSVGFKKLTFSHWGKAKWPINENTKQHTHSTVSTAQLSLSRSCFCHGISSSINISAWIHCSIPKLLHFKTFICQKVFFRKLFDSSYFDQKWRSFRILYDD